MDRTLAMPAEGRQFAILYRDFLFRMVDLELIPTRGGIENLLGQLVALLAAFSFVLALFLISGPTSSAAWGHQEFLIATSMAIAGLFAVLAWNSILLDRRDRFVLGMLPVRTRTIFAAKIASVGTALTVSVIAVNIFTGLSLPFRVAADASGALGVLRSLGAYWITMFAAALFVFCALLAIHGLAAQLFSYRLFQRASAFL